MPQQGNGAPEPMGAPNVEPFGRHPPPPPAPTRGEYERKVAFEAEAQRRARDQQAGIKGQPALAHQVPVDPAIDFMARIDNAAALLADVGSEIGAVGHDDKAALQQFAKAMAENTRRYVGQLVERKRRELADLERILGKL